MTVGSGEHDHPGLGQARVDRLAYQKAYSRISLVTLKEIPVGITVRLAAPPWITPAHYPVFVADPKSLNFRMTLSKADQHAFNHRGIEFTCLRPILQRIGNPLQGKINATSRVGNVFTQQIGQIAGVITHLLDRPFTAGDQAMGGNRSNDSVQGQQNQPEPEQIKSSRPRCHGCAGRLVLGQHAKISESPSLAQSLQQGGWLMCSSGTEACFQDGATATLPFPARFTTYIALSAALTSASTNHNGRLLSRNNCGKQHPNGNSLWEAAGRPFR